ncbi:MAG: four helix bundle protein, partial [Candidatus Margulisbacteria bacterium]|nr:four helix bundle protein [Candidatus Margulisiibacteriota bacterium]
MKFDFEDFPVYKEAIQFYEELDIFIESLPEKRTRRIIDQIERAAISISLNIAEGAGRFHKADKKNYYI